ncbi:MAG: ABC transporter substrate-binding protein [Atopobiaceae bacterium]
MITRKQFVAASVGAVFSGALVACSSGNSSSSNQSQSADASGYTLVKEGTLIGVSDMAYPPLESIPEGSTTPEGFEIDLTTAIAEKLGLSMEWLPATRFDTIIPLIKQGGRADVGVSAFTITDARKQEIDFSDSYLDSNQGLVTRIDAQNKTAESLNVAGTQVACQAGTTGESWIEENLPQAEVVPLDDAIQAMTGVSTGLYAACVADLPVVSYLCNASYTDCEVALQIPTGEQYGIVVSKQNAKLTEDINTALQELQDDGTVASLEEKWFGSEL